jgi:hypothetical protein
MINFKIIFILIVLLGLLQANSLTVANGNGPQQCFDSGAGNCVPCYAISTAC